MAMIWLLEVPLRGRPVAMRFDIDAQISQTTLDGVNWVDSRRPAEEVAGIGGGTASVVTEAEAMTAVGVHAAS